MGVDVPNVAWFDSGVGQRLPYGLGWILARRIDRGDVGRVGGEPEAEELRIDRRASRFGVAQLFEHQGRGAFAHDETVAVEVERSARACRIVVARR